MGLYNDLGIRDDMTDAELATYLYTERSIWNSKRSSTDSRERMKAEQMVRYIDVLSGAEARIGDFAVPSLVIKTLCVAIDHQYADYRGLEDTVLRSVGSGIYRGEFRTVLGYLNSNGAQEVTKEWRRVLHQMGIELPAARNMSRGSAERSEQREYLERHREDSDRERTDHADRHADRAESEAGAGAEREASGKNRGGSAHRRKKATWQRKVRRFFRRLGRNIRRMDWAALPKIPIIIIAAVVAALIVIAVVASNVSRSNATKKAQQAATEQSAAAASSAEMEAQAQQEALISRLRGMENYTISQDASENGPVSTLTAVVPATYEASSVLTSTSGKSYGPENLFDGDMSTNWQEGAEDEGLGVTITSTFASETDVRGIAIWGGNESSQESYTANNRPQQITISVSCDGQSYSKAYTLDDVDGVQTILFDSAVPMQSVVIRIDSVYNGATYNDTVITELSFLTDGSGAADGAGSTAESGAADSAGSTTESGAAAADAAGTETTGTAEESAAGSQ